MGTRDVRDTQSIQLKRTLLRKTLKTKEALSLNFEHKHQLLSIEEFAAISVARFPY